MFSDLTRAGLAGTACQSRRAFVLLALVPLLCAPATLAQVGPIPQGVVPPDESEDYTAQVRQHLSLIGDDRDRAISGAIDPIGYLRSDFDNLPPQMLEAFSLLGATVKEHGLDPNDPNRVLREIRFDDRALIKFGGERFRAGDRLILHVSIANSGRGMMRLVKAQLSQVSPSSEPPAR